MVKKILLIALFSFCWSVASATDYSFLTDSTTVGNTYCAIGKSSCTRLDNYTSGSGTGYLDSMKIWIYTLNGGTLVNDSLFGLVYATDGSSRIAISAMVHPDSANGQHAYILRFDHTVSISASTKYWVGIGLLSASSGNYGTASTAQSATVTYYTSQNTVAYPFSDAVQAYFRYVGAEQSNNELYPMRMNVWYSSGSGGGGGGGSTTSNTVIRGSVLRGGVTR